VAGLRKDQGMSNSMDMQKAIMDVDDPINGVTSVKFIGRGTTNLPAGAVGKVVKINQRTARVDFGEYGSSWYVDASLLEAVS